MSKKFIFSESIKTLDDRIISTLKEISSSFGDDENSRQEIQLPSMGLNGISDETLSKFQQQMISWLSLHCEIGVFLFPQIEKIRRIYYPHHHILGNEDQNNLWSEVCYHVEQSAYKCVEKNYMTSVLSYNMHLLKNLMSQLYSIFEPKIAWKKYKRFRYAYLSKITSFSETCCCFHCFCCHCISFLKEDEFLTSLHPHTLNQYDLISTYTSLLEEQFCRNINYLKDIKSNADFKFSSSCQNKRSKEINSCFRCAIHKCLQSIAIQEESELCFSIKILNIIEVLWTIDEEIAEIFLKKERNYHKHTKDVIHLNDESKWTLVAESPEQSPFCKHNTVSPRLSVETEVLSLLPDWRSKLVDEGFLSKLQKSLQSEIEITVSKLVEHESKTWKSTKHWRDLLFPESIVSFSSESLQTRTVLPSILNTVLILEKYLPALKSHPALFAPSFCHVLQAYLITLVSHLRMIGQSDLQLKYVVLNSGLFLRDRLSHYYSDFLKGYVCESQDNVLCSVSRFCDEITESIKLHQFHYIACGILFDADSHHYEDIKHFYEGERVSFSVQMWHAHMRAVLHDLSFFLPQNVAQDLFASLLTASLEQWSGRIARALPSEARTSQLGNDARVLLLIASELVFYACTSLSMLVHSNDEEDENDLSSFIHRFHSCCNSLLASSVVLSAPAFELHRSFHKGYHQARLALHTRNLAPWWPWIREDIFSDTSSSMYLWISIRLCTAWALPNPPALVAALTDYNCTLPILLMRQANDCVSSESVKVHLAQSIFQVLICFQHAPYLRDILMPLLEKSEDWMDLDMCSRKKRMSQKRWWFKGLYQIIHPYLNSVYEDIIHIWFKWSTKESLDDVFKNCSFPLLTNEINKPFRFMCLKVLLESMERNLIILPIPIQSMLVLLNEHVSNYVPEVSIIPPYSLPVQVLLICMIDFLSELKLSDVQKRTSVIAALNALLANDLVENELEVLEVLLQSFHDHFEDLKEEIVSQCKEDIRDERIELTVKTLLQTYDGISALGHLHSLLRVNESWIRKSLGVPEFLSPNSVPLCPSPKFSSSGPPVWEHDTTKTLIKLELTDVSSSVAYHFNPLAVFDKLGDTDFSEMTTLPSFHWPSIVEDLPGLGLTEANLKSLLTHRWDFRSCESFPDQRYVDELRTTFSLTSH